MSNTDHPDDIEGGEVTSEYGPFAMVPIWVLNVGLKGAELAVYVALRSFADRGRRAHPRVRTIAQRAGVNQRTAERAIDRMRDLGLITTERIYREDGGVAGCNYSLRDAPITADPPPDPDTPLRSTDRTPSGPQTGPPPVHRPEQEQTRGTDQRNRETPPESLPRSKRGTRLPADWQPSPALREWTRQKTPHIDGPLEVEKFRDYWTAQPGARGVKTDWDATWRNWARNAMRDTPQRNGQKKTASTTSERVAAGLALADKYRALENAQSEPESLFAIEAAQ